MLPDDRHPSLDELADLALGVLADAEAAAIKVHIAACLACMQLFRQLNDDLPTLLANIWFPPIAEHTSERIETALAAEARHRAAVASGPSPVWRREGVVDSAAGLGLSDHLCWAYRSRADWADRAVEFSADGIVAGQHVEFVGDPSTAGLRSELAEIVSSLPASRAPDAGIAAISDLTDNYEVTSDGIIDPDASIANRRAKINEALAAGYTGLRLVVES